MRKIRRLLADKLMRFSIIRIQFGYVFYGIYTEFFSWVTFVSPPVQLLLNAEGTRFTPKKHEASVKFARERGMTELKHHLIPRSKGFTASLPYLKEKCPCLLDIQLAFDPNAKVNFSY